MTLPRPPGDAEKYWFLGRQHRWLVFVQAFSYAGVGLSLYRFAHLSYWTLICLLPLAVYTLELALAFRTTLFRRRVFRADHEPRVAAWQQEQLARQSFPSVDVYLPTAGEDLEVLANTYRYVSSITWPGRITTYVLDDAGRPDVLALAQSHGFEYIHREGSAFKKAGNLNNAFHLTDGDFILLFDADFVPRPDIMLELIPYMDDPSVGIVQSPQVFDTTKEMNWLERGAGATQELFYRFIQPSRDSVGAAICVGTSALYRRAALATVDGFPLIDHSEDMYTGISIKENGYTTRYVPVILSRGTCPDTMNAFIMQQYRWCEGSLHMLTDPAFHLNRKLTLTQRMSFWAGILYYLTTAMNGFLGPLPIVIILIWYPDAVHPANMVYLFGPLLMWFVIYPLLFKYRWRVETLRVQMIYSYTHAVTFWHMLKNTYVEWVPTGGKSTATPLVVTVRGLLKYYASFTQLAMIVFFAIDCFRFGVERYWVTALLGGLNLYIAGPVIYLAWRPANGTTSLASDAAAWLRNLARPLDTPIIARYARERFTPSRPPLSVAQLSLPSQQVLARLMSTRRASACVRAIAWMQVTGRRLDEAVVTRFLTRRARAVIAVLPSLGWALARTRAALRRQREHLRIVVGLTSIQLREQWRNRRRLERPDWLDAAAQPAELDLIELSEP